MDEPEGYEAAEVGDLQIGQEAAFITLVGSETGKTLTMVTSREQGERIILALNGKEPERPDAAQLLIQLSLAKGIKLAYVTIDRLEADIYYATLHFEGNLKLDSRPSDAIIIALRLDKKIYVNPQLWESSGRIMAVQDIKKRKIA